MLMLIPQSPAYAMEPAAVTSLMIAAAIGRLAVAGLPEHWDAALVLALLSGLMQIAMGGLRLGFPANYLSHPVISA